jgi:probable F420-dependent oxidoreductase
MRFGMQLPVQAQSRLMAQEWEFSQGPDAVARIAIACDEAGFDYVGVCDHVGVPEELAGRMGTMWYDTVATMGWLAAQTSRVRLLSHVYVVVYRHPLATAKAFSTLDALSNGRIVLGVGVGHVEAEFAALEIPFERRGAMADDYIARIRGAFEDEWGSSVLGQAPRPVQPGGPPIWVGGSSPAALRRAGQLGDGWLPQGPPPGGMEAAIQTIADHRQQRGLSMDGFAVGGGFSCYVGQPSFEVPPTVVCGSVEQIQEAVDAQAGLGITHSQVRFPSRSLDELLDQVAAFAAIRGTQS